MALIDVLVVAADAQALRRHAHAVLDDPALRLAAAVRSGTAALALLDAAAPDVLLLDPGLGEFYGLERLCHAVRQYPCCALLVVMQSSADEHGVAALAAGCLPRHASPERIAAAIGKAHADTSRLRLAAQGHRLPRLAGPSDREPDAQPAAAAARAPLTARETEILRLIEKGLAFSTVGALLDISPHTVVAHLKKIYTKLAVHTRGAAVHEASQLGLL